MLRRLVALLAALMLIVAACGGTGKPSGSTTPTPTGTLSYLNEGVTAGFFNAVLPDGEGGAYLAVGNATSDGGLTNELYHLMDSTASKIADLPADVALVGVFGGDVVIAEGTPGIFPCSPGDSCSPPTNSTELDPVDASMVFRRVDAAGVSESLTVSGPARSALLWLAYVNGQRVAGGFSSAVRGIPFSGGVAFATTVPYPALPMGSYYLSDQLVLTPLIAGIGDQSIFAAGNSLYASGYNAGNTGGNAAFAASTVDAIAACAVADRPMSFVARFAAGSTTPAAVACLGEAGRVSQFGVAADGSGSELYIGIDFGIFRVVDSTATRLTGLPNPGDSAMRLTTAISPQPQPYEVGTTQLFFARVCDQEFETCDESVVSVIIPGAESVKNDPFGLRQVLVPGSQIDQITPIEGGGAYLLAGDPEPEEVTLSYLAPEKNTLTTVSGVTLNPGSWWFEFYEVAGGAYLIIDGSIYTVEGSTALLLGEGSLFLVGERPWVITGTETGDTRIRPLDTMR